MKKIAILTDSSAQIERGQIDGVFIAPLQIIIGNDSFLDQVEVKDVDLFKRMKDEGIMPKTSQPATGIVVEVLEEIKKDYDAVLIIPMASGLTSTLQGMLMAADIVGIEAYSIDSKTTCHSLVEVIQAARHMLDEGKDVLEVIEMINPIVDETETLIVPTNLDYLMRSGRLTKGAAILGAMLKISPVLRLNPELNGKVDTVTKVRTIKKAYQEMIRYVIDKGANASDYIFTVGHVLNLEVANLMIDELKSQLGQIEVHLVNFPTTVGCHTGVGCIGIQTIKRIMPKK